MEKYQSFHFSPLNNRSMLMPRIPKGTEYHVDSSRLVNPFEPIPEEVLKGRAPYSLLNSGFFKKEIELEGDKTAVWTLCTAESLVKRCLCSDFCGKWCYSRRIYKDRKLETTSR